MSSILQAKMSVRGVLLKKKSSLCVERNCLRYAYCLQTKIMSQSGDRQEEPWCTSLCASSDTQWGMVLNSYIDIAEEHDSSVSRQDLQQIALSSYQGFIHSKENCTQQMSTRVNVSFHLNVK